MLAGNRRDAVIESGLRLQLNGEVAKDVHVQAVLTDESTPILPEGTTQRLSELDRVYINIEAPLGLAQLGDFEIAYDAGEFAKLRRKVQGVSLMAPFSLSGHAGSARIVGAAARGMFRRQRIAVTDGVQGPYRLSGEHHEQFIFVVPGSEGVYLNGQRLQRGQTQDYVMDYATGEVTFTTSHLIRHHDRVVVEYQYRTTEYTRSLAAASSDVVLGKRTRGPARATFGATVLREADGRTLSEAYGLTADDEALLQAAGDSIATRSGATVVPYEAEAPYVQYVRKDTLSGGTTHDIFVALTHATAEPVYRVHFTRTGPGRGSYVRQGQATNGLVYAWRGPGRGNYVPLRILPRPRQQRMVDLRGSVTPVRQLQLFGEWAQSLYDRNRLSQLHQGDDAGIAYMGGARLMPLAVGLGTVAFNMHRRHASATFASFDRIRPVEFERLWNLDAQQSAATRRSVTGASETVDEVTFAWQATAGTHLEATMGRIVLGSDFKAQRQEMGVTLDERRGPRVRYHLVTIRSQDDVRMEAGTWLRQGARLSMPIFKDRLVPAVQVWQERRALTTAGGDSLVAPSEAYVQATPGITWHSPMGEIGASVDVRTDERASAGTLRKQSMATTWNLHFDLKPHRTLTAEGRAGLRHRKVGAAFLEEGQAGGHRSAVVRWSGRFRPWQRALQLHWFYEALSERTPSLQEIYIRTGAELGEYVWVDANGNGVIELDEFLPESTQDEGDYVRTFIPSDSLQSVTGLQARLSVDVDPVRRWRTAPMLRHVSLRTVVNIQEKSRNPSLSDVYFLRLETFRSGMYTLKGLFVLQQDLLLFRGMPQYGADFSYRQVRGLSELAAGTESRAADEYRAALRAKVRKRWGVAFTASSGRRRTTSESFASRNYDIETLAFAPELTWHASHHLQLTLTATHALKSAPLVRGSLWRMPLEVRYARARRLNVAGRLEAATVVVRGESSGSGLAFFELTDGRGAGTLAHVVPVFMVPAEQRAACHAGLQRASPRRRLGHSHRAHAAERHLLALRPAGTCLDSIVYIT